MKDSYIAYLIREYQIYKLDYLTQDLNDKIDSGPLLSFEEFVETLYKSNNK